MKKVPLQSTGDESFNRRCDFVHSVMAPIWWQWSKPEVDGTWKHGMGMGTIFFVSMDGRYYGITAAHVLKGYEDEYDVHNRLLSLCKVGSPLEGIIEFNWQERVEAYEEGLGSLDLAVLRFTAEEIKQIKRTAIACDIKNWPPHVAKDDVIFFGGYPEGRRRSLPNTQPNNQESWYIDAYVYAGVVEKVDDSDVTVQWDLSKKHLGIGENGETFNTAGFSGGPLLRERRITESFSAWTLAGIVVGGVYDSVFKARKVNFLTADGKLRTKEWWDLNPLNKRQVQELQEKGLK